MFAGPNIPDSFVDYNALGFDGILGTAGDIVHFLIFVFLAALSMLNIEPHGRPPV